ncbi:hypothetical protein TSUD_192930 [Trifolium subterraneum]|uniref:Uncharacterized protein n=1 Tax=Trifolium subterraneum TaxID=3900 RepID=A0A2Z6PAN3_TRISU|nr:hypothetical protein TSUD_192930 [Trifolium subterraneum]
MAHTSKLLISGSCKVRVTCFLCEVQTVVALRIEWRASIYVVRVKSVYNKKIEFHSPHEKRIKT